jgi:hypothetical protein
MERFGASTSGFGVESDLLDLLTGGHGYSAPPGAG